MAGPSVVALSIVTPLVGHIYFTTIIVPHISAFFSGRMSSYLYCTNHYLDRICRKSSLILALNEVLDL